MYGRAEMARRAKIVVVPRLQIGLIDLETAASKKKPAVSELIDECEAREIAVKTATKGRQSVLNKRLQWRKSRGVSFIHHGDFRVAAVPESLSLLLSYLCM